MLGFFYGILLIVCLYNSILFIYSREKLYIKYVLYIVSCILLCATIDGLAFTYLWPNHSFLNYWFNYYIAPWSFIGTFLWYSISFIEVNKYAKKGVVAYAASKGAVNALTRAIAVDYAGEQIRCNAVLPGCVDTPMLRATAQSFKGERSEEDLLHEWGLSHPIGRMASIHDIGNLVGFLCSDKSSFVTGASYVIDGGLITQVPVILPE